MKLEHANITVPSTEEARRFLGTAFPEFRVRGQGLLGGTSGTWVHFGDDDTYVALQENKQHSARSDVNYTNDGINHLGFVIDDMDGLLERMEGKGYTPSAGSDLEGHPHRKRAYFFDKNGFEWEFVEYLSEIPSEKNLYE